MYRDICMIWSVCCGHAVKCLRGFSQFFCAKAIVSLVNSLPHLEKRDKTHEALERYVFLLLLLQRFLWEMSVLVNWQLAVNIMGR